MNPAATDRSIGRIENKQERKGHGTQSVDAHRAGDGVGGLVVRGTGRICDLKDMLREGRCGKRPHGEECKPAKKLHHTQLRHDPRHRQDGPHDVGHRPCKTR